jgi:NAD(P)-dependent dehydrogenase (short-subunit alcohol dehydrogenase family)
LAAYIAEKETHVDVLVSNAGIRRDPSIQCNVQTAPLKELQASMWSSDHSDWMDTFAINSTAHYFISVAFLPLLAAASKLNDGKQGRGSVIITSSCASMHNVTNIDLTSYATSKAATDHLVKLLAAKFSRFYVRVVGINPGCKFSSSSSCCHDGMLRTITDAHIVVPSKMNPVGEQGNIFSNLFNKVPAKRSGSEEDMAGAVLYLASRAGVSNLPIRIH